MFFDESFSSGLKPFDYKLSTFFLSSCEFDKYENKRFFVEQKTEIGDFFKDPQYKILCILYIQAKLQDLQLLERFMNQPLPEEDENDLAIRDLLIQGLPDQFEKYFYHVTFAAFEDVLYKDLVLNFLPYISIIDNFIAKINCEIELVRNRPGVHFLLKSHIMYEIKGNDIAIVYLDDKYKRNGHYKNVLRHLFDLSFKTKKAVMFGIKEYEIPKSIDENIIKIYNPIKNEGIIKGFTLRHYSGHVYVFGKKFDIGYYPKNLMLAKQIKTIYRDYFSGVEYMYKIGELSYCLCQVYEGFENQANEVKFLEPILEKFCQRFEGNDFEAYKREDSLIYLEMKGKNLDLASKTLESIMSKNLNKLKTSLGELKAQYDEMMEAQIKIAKSIEETKARIEMEERFGSKDVFCKNIISSIDKIQSLKSVSSVIIDDAKINIMTNNMYCKNVKTGELHYLGKFIISIKFNCESLKDKSIIVSSLSHSWPNAASHIKADGAICFGPEFGKTLATLYASGDFYMVAFHVIKFLKIYTPGDGLDIVQYFPQANEEQIEEAKSLGYRVDIPVNITY